MSILTCDHINPSCSTVRSCVTQFITLCSEVVTFESVDEIVPCRVPVQMKDTEKYFSCGPVCYALQGGSIFSVLKPVVVEYLKTDHSN